MRNLLWVKRPFLGKKQEGRIVPIIRVDRPPVTEVAKKRAFVKCVTEAAAAFYGLPEHVIIVLLQENTPENVGVGGELLVDLHAGKPARE
jgi:4-oxalocrotonate tautomerase